MGTWWVKLKVHDRRGGSDEANFTFRVINVNDEPFAYETDMKIKTDEDSIYELNLKDLFYD